MCSRTHSFLTTPLIVHAETCRHLRSMRSSTATITPITMPIILPTGAPPFLEAGSSMPPRCAATSSSRSICRPAQDKKGVRKTSFASSGSRKFDAALLRGHLKQPVDLRVWRAHFEICATNYYIRNSLLDTSRPLICCAAAAAPWSCHGCRCRFWCNPRP